MDITPEKIIGSGNEAVYLYYYGNDKRLAELEGRDCWECKIGKSLSRSSDRVLSQVRSERPRLPVLAVEVRTDKAYSLESSIHAKMRHSKIQDDRCGDEWFFTNPREFVRVAKSALSEMDLIVDVCGDDFGESTFLVEEYQDWGFAISSLRSELGMTQRQLSDAAGMRQGTISSMENGGPVKLSSIWGLIRLLGYSAILVKKD